MVVYVIAGIILLIIAAVIYLEYRNEKKYQEQKRRAEEKRRKKPTPKVTKRTPSDKEQSKPLHPKPRQTTPPSPESQKPTPLPKNTYELKKGGDKKPEKDTKSELEKTVKPDKDRTLSKATKPSNKPYELKEQPAKTIQKTGQIKTEERPKSEKKSEKEPELKPKSEAKPTEKKPPSDVELPKGDYPEFNYERLLEMGLSEEEAKVFVQELIPQIGEQIPLLDEAMKIPDFHEMERLTHSIKGSSTTIGTGGVSDLLVEYNTYLKSGKDVPVAEAYQTLLKKYFEKLKKQFPSE
ncbi:MAG: Hpt domain-containing protein [Sulfurovum sp.]|nr:Hpt domain-containing protein [Sulfurovum sp.]